MMLARGVVVSHETIRAWCAKFGQTYANGLRRRRARPGDKWHLDDVFIKIGEKTPYLWRAVDQHGERAGHSGHLPAGRHGCDQVLSQAAEGPGICAPGAGHRQARQLPNGASAGVALGGASPVEVSEQSGRELPPAHPSPGTSDEEVHLSRARATVPLRVQRDIPALPTPPPPNSPPRNTGTRWAPDSAPGTRSRARPRQSPEHRSRDRLGCPAQVPRIHRRPEARQIDNALLSVNS